MSVLSPTNLMTRPWRCAVDELIAANFIGECSTVAKHVPCLMNRYALNSWRLP